MVPRLEWYSRRPQGSQSEGRFNQSVAFTVADWELILLSTQPCDVSLASPISKRFQLSGNPLRGSVGHQEINYVIVENCGVAGLVWYPRPMTSLEIRIGDGPWTVVLWCDRQPAILSGLDRYPVVGDRSEINGELWRVA